MGWDINIFRGVLTGYNKAFIIDESTKDRLIDEDPRSAEIIKPLLRGRDVQKYYPVFNNHWLINLHNGLKNNKIIIPALNINDYPAVKEYLDQFFEKLSARADQGKTPYNLRNCAYLTDF